MVTDDRDALVTEDVTEAPGHGHARQPRHLCVVHAVAEGVVTTARGSELRSGRCGSGSWSSLLPSPALASIFSAVSGGAMSHPRAVGLPLEQYKLASRRIWHEWEQLVVADLGKNINRNVNTNKCT